MKVSEKYSKLSLAIQRFIDTTATGCTIDREVMCGDGRLTLKYTLKAKNTGIQNKEKDFENE